MNTAFEWLANGFILFLIGLFLFWGWLEVRALIDPLKAKWAQVQKEGLRSLLEPAPLSAEFYETQTVVDNKPNKGSITTSAALREFIVSVERPLPATQDASNGGPTEMAPPVPVEEKLSASARALLQVPCPSDLRYQMAWIHAVDARGERWLEIPVAEAWDYASPQSNEQPMGLEGAFDVKLFIQTGRKRELIKSTARSPEGQWRVMLFRVQDLAVVVSKSSAEES